MQAGSFFNLDRTRETQRLHHCNDRVHVDFLGKGGGMASGTPLAVWPSRTGGGYSEPPTCKSLAIPNGLLVGTPERSKCSLRMTFWRRKVALTPHFDKVVRAAVDGEEWAQSDRTHEVVTRETPHTALPLAVYLDGVAPSSSVWSGSSFT